LGLAVFVTKNPRRLPLFCDLQIQAASVRMFTLCSHEPGKLAFILVTLNAFNGHRDFPRFFPRMGTYLGTF
jgi:hypothetical protein